MVKSNCKIHLFVSLLFPPKLLFYLRTLRCYMIMGWSGIDIFHSAVDEDLENDGSSRINSLLHENQSLRARILELESMERNSSDDDSVGSRTPSSTQSQISASASEDIHVTFERLHLDFDARGSSENSSNSDPLASGQVWRMLPTRSVSENVVQFSLSMLGWVHCALDAPSFESEHTEFWSFLLNFEDQKLLNNHSWMAIYFSVIAVGQILVT
jgi:hypothetical protein